MIIQTNVFEHSAEPDGVVDFGLLFSTKTHTLGIAPTLNIEHSLLSPNVLIISDKLAISDCAEGSLSSA